MTRSLVIGDRVKFFELTSFDCQSEKLNHMVWLLCAASRCNPFRSSGASSEEPIQICGVDSPPRPMSGATAASYVHRVEFTGMNPRQNNIGLDFESIRNGRYRHRLRLRRRCHFSSPMALRVSPRCNRCLQLRQKFDWNETPATDNRTEFIRQDSPIERVGDFTRRTTDSPRSVRHCNMGLRNHFPPVGLCDDGGRHHNLSNP